MELFHYGFPFLDETLNLCVKWCTPETSPFMSVCTHLRPININLGFCSVHNIYTLSFRRMFSHNDWSVVLYKLGRNSLLLNQIVAERKEERRPLRAQRPILQLSLHF